MSEEAKSARRRHILSSINPDGGDPERSLPQKRARRHSSHSATPAPAPAPADDHPAEKPGADDRGHDDDDDTTRPRRSRLKLKDPSRRRHRSRSPVGGGDDDQGRPRRHRRHHHHRHSHRRRRDRSPTPPNPFEEPALDPDTAFRESLFDAMADDEGADYWAAVYGQPVHVYSNERTGPQGELERMTDEEYASYVRQRMWEKTHAGILEERARREEARRRQRDEDKRRRRARRDVEESLRRDEERRSRRRYVDAWDDYQRRWAAWDGDPTTLAWPLVSGDRADISTATVREFMVNGPDDDGDKKSLGARLRDERVRWHPDKIMQKAGGQVDETVMKDVTAIFQIIDRLWGEVRAKD